MFKISLQFFILFTAVIYSFNSYSIAIPACNTEECIDYFKQYKKYSKAGYSDAMTTLGDLYFNGHGTDKNVKKALKEYKKGAKYGSVNGQYKAAMIYLNHKDYKDIAKGIKYLEKAARGKSKEAAFLLGVIFYKEDFYERDFDKSDKWLTKAYQTKHRHAVSFIRMIEESNELNSNNYPDLLAAIAEEPLPPIKTVEKVEKPQTASIQSPNSGQAPKPQQQPPHQKVQHPKGGNTEVITITTTLHDMFAAQLASLKGTYPQKGDVGTGSKIIGRTCEKMISCSIVDRDDFDRMLVSILGVAAADAHRSF